MAEISIIIPLYKGNKYCQSILTMIEQNVLYQDFYQVCDVEVIFVNDYPSEEITFNNQYHEFTVKFLEQTENKGIHASRVKGFNAAEGKYIIMLDQDDLVKENWLYSQWHKIVKAKGEYCVCNGWKGRFQTLWNQSTMRRNVNDIHRYLMCQNPIISPGQVIIKREAIPRNWIKYIQIYNGSDDFLLWILALKERHRFLLNDTYLFYHTPERTLDSIKLEQMLESNRETQRILDSLKVLSYEEKNIFEQYLKQQESFVNIKYYLMFRTVHNWLRLKNRGIYIESYLISKGWNVIAIYGMGYLGECLYEELENTDIQVLYGIDQSARDYMGEFHVYQINEQLENVDMIIVTFESDLLNTKKYVQNKMKCPVFSLYEILIDMGCM